MNLVVPVVGLEVGPDWANDLNASLIILDGHTHLPGSGVQITPSAININADLTFNSANNAVALRSVRFKPQGAPLALVADVGCIYEAGLDLYYNDGAGNQIRITQSGSVAGSSGTITGLPSGTASASFQSSTGTFVFQQATSVAANLDVGSVIVRYPGSYPTPSGNAIILEAPSSLASQYALTLPALPAQTNVMTLGTTGIISSTTWDAVGTSMTATGANAIRATMTKTVSNTAPLGGVMTTPSCGSFSTASLSLTPITNLSGTLTTAGKPIVLMIQSDANISGAFYSFSSAGGSPLFNIVYVIDGVSVGYSQYGLTTLGTRFAPGSLNFVATGIAAGAHTISLQCFVISGTSATLFMTNCTLVAYELN